MLGRGPFKSFIGLGRVGAAIVGISGLVGLVGPFVLSLNGRNTLVLGCAIPITAVVAFVCGPGLPSRVTRRKPKWLQHAHVPSSWATGESSQRASAGDKCPMQLCLATPVALHGLQPCRRLASTGRFYRSPGCGLARGAPSPGCGGGASWAIGTARETTQGAAGVWSTHRALRSAGLGKRSESPSLAVGCSPPEDHITIVRSFRLGGR
jgi:hypothetical protein